MRFAFIALAAAVIFSPLAAYSQSGCVTGVVVDNLGQSLKGMQVGLAEHTWNGGQQPAGQAVTDESGAFEIDGVPPGKYDMGAFNDAMGYPGTLPLRPVVIVASAPCTNITYNAGARAAKLKFTVTDVVTHKPVSDILVLVSPARQQGSRMSIRPEVVEPLVPSLARLHIEITAQGYSQSVVELPALKPGETREIVAAIAPKNLGCITGTAVDDSFVPVKGATIAPIFLGEGFVGGQTPVQTDDEGRFKVDRLLPGDYNLYPEKESDGFSRLWVGWLDQPGLPKVQRITIPATGECKRVTVNMGARGAWLNVTAIDGATQEQLPEMVITFLNSEHRRQGGSVSLAEPREVLVPSHAKFTVRVRAKGYRTSESIQVDSLMPGEKKVLTVPLQRELTAATSAGSG
jgi:hypothetical protein